MVLICAFAATLLSGATLMANDGHDLRSWAVIWSEGDAQRTVHTVFAQRSREAQFRLTYFVAPDARSYSAWVHGDGRQGLVYSYAQLTLNDREQKELLDAISEACRSSSDHRATFPNERAPFHFGRGAAVFSFRERSCRWRFDQFSDLYALSGAKPESVLVRKILTPIRSRLDIDERRADSDQILRGRGALVEIADLGSSWARALSIRALATLGVELWREGLTSKHPFVRESSLYGLIWSLESEAARTAAVLDFFERETNQHAKEACLRYLVSLELAGPTLQRLQGLLVSSLSESGAFLASVLAQNGLRGGLDWFASHLERNDIPVYLYTWLNEAVQSPTEGDNRQAWIEMLKDKRLAWSKESRRFRIE